MDIILMAVTTYSVMFQVPGHKTRNHIYDWWFENLLIMKQKSTKFT